MYNKLWQVQRWENKWSQCFNEVDEVDWGLCDYYKSRKKMEKPRPIFNQYYKRV